MKPNELYAREPEQVVSFIDTEFCSFAGGYISGCYYNHIPEIDGHAKYNSTDRIKIKIYKDFDFDGRRFWRLSSLWLDDKPVMIMQNAGREGDDHAERIITDREQYVNLVALLMYLQIPDELDLVIVDPNEDIPYLDTFYGNTLDGWFERYRY